MADAADIGKEKNQSRLITFVAEVVSVLLKVSFALYDAATYIPNKIFADPAKVLQRSNRIKAAPTIPGNPASPWHNIEVSSGAAQNNEPFPGCDTIGKVWDECVRRYGPFDCYGVRPVLSVRYEKQPNGKIFEKVTLDDYQWTTFNEASIQVDAIAKGLRECGLQMREKVINFSETCAESMLTSFACFKCGFPLTTVYATLGDEAVLYAINECEATAIFVSAANLPKLARVIAQCKYLRIIVYYPFRDPEATREIPQALRDNELLVVSFEALVETGKRSVRDASGMVQANDLAMIMYTSGTTGNPKGVLLTHKNIMSATCGQQHALNLRSDDVVICYLPQAHIYEVCLEIDALVRGCKLGFASVQTLLDHATKLLPGQISDCRALKPTIMACVPTIMNRIRKEVVSTAEASPLKSAIYHAFYKWAKSRFLAGYPQFIFDKIVFKQIREILGGRITCLVSGSAPLNPETHLFMTIGFGCTVLQGYGLTETSGGASVQVEDDRNTGVVGPPLCSCEIMLKEWNEGGYSPNNEKPQGEILISGDCVSSGYFNNPEKTAEEFSVINGRRWFCTGDIGEFSPDGQLRIIDRKKDLVKLSHGEYISLGKVESVIVTDPLVDNICVCAGFNKSFLVALVVPNLKCLAELAKKIGVKEKDEKGLCKNDKVKEAFLASIQGFCKDKLLRVETPQRVYLCSEVWTPASGLVTEALKLKRKCIEKAFKSQIDEMYAE